ncbi:MAG: hypothetical protein WBE20_15075 [Candidatus Acidiferrales bacterium]
MLRKLRYWQDFWVAREIAAEVRLKFLGRFFRYIFWIVVTAGITWLVRKMFQQAMRTSVGSPRGPVRVEPPAAPQQLFRDPVCGTYVAENISHSLVQGSQTLHFCSRNCIEQYRAADRLAAGA